MTNALGNLILLVILLCLVAIPVLIYFTDMPSRLKLSLRELNAGAHPAAAGGGDQELGAALQRIQRLEMELAEVRAESASPSPHTPAAKPSPKPAPQSAPAPLVLPREEYDVAKLFNGVNVRTTLDLKEGASASRERVKDEAYEFEVKLKINVPKANQSLAELTALNPKLPGILPGLEKMLASGKVSPFYEKLYDEKHQRIKSSVTRLDSLETRHNYFDCETILDLTHPDTGQKVLLMQGEMDVVADGSDGDRMPEIDDYISLSNFYQPTTSYGWRKRTQTPNPLLARLEKELDEVVKEYAIPGLAQGRNDYLLARRNELQRIIPDLEARSYLIAEADPFIVLPLSLLGASGAHAPQTGDYAVVIHEDKAYPVICGDAGPRWKMGEASLFVATTINESSSPYSRPVSDLQVTYAIFPGSADPQKGPPDLAKWTAKCQQLLDGAGGLGAGYALYDWRDIIAERRAVRESKKLIGAATRQLADADGFAKSAKDAAELAKKNRETAGKTLQDAKTAAETTLDIDALQAKANAAAAASEEAVAAATDAASAAADVKKAVAEIEAAAKTAKEASEKSPKTPKAQTTDLALAALATAESAYARAEAGANTAKQAAATAKAAVGN